MKLGLAGLRSSLTQHLALPSQWSAHTPSPVQTT